MPSGTTVLACGPSALCKCCATQRTSALATSDDDPAGGDAIEELSELFRPLLDACFDGGRRVHVAEGNLER